MSFATNNDQTLYEEIRAASIEFACVTHGPVICEHQEADQMVQTIKTACIAGTNNPDYQLTSVLGCPHSYFVLSHGICMIVFLAPTVAARSPNLSTQTISDFGAKARDTQNQVKPSGVVLALEQTRKTDRFLQSLSRRASAGVKGN
ncbi:unnamed protein product [Phytophthora lilii]|uniref:Unnamed protein product n=1 Tax=Phytophthora lilii TaxID=2077276 RepID=A0A9W6WZ44_9STRA|nr:unnamed protein product [Phytophthora lilii]